MSTNPPRIETLPTALTRIQLKHLFTLRLQAAAPAIVGQTPAHFRRVITVPGGSFESAHDGLNGRVLAGGTDWQTVRTDHTTTLDVRLVLETTGGELIGMTYTGYRHGAPETLAKLDRGEAVDPGDYYFRTAAFLETASERFAWLNRIVAIATGHRFPDGPLYNVFEVL